MATIPSRTRSIRKPPLPTKQSDYSTTTTLGESSSSRSIGVPSSPSKLPKPASSTTAASTFGGPMHISHGSSSGKTTMMPPPRQRPDISRPPLTTDNKPSSIRSGARTPAEASSVSSLRRAASTRTHTRNQSTSVIPSTSRVTSTSSCISNTSTTAARPRTRPISQIYPSRASTTIRPSSSASHSSGEAVSKRSHPISASHSTKSSISTIPSTNGSTGPKPPHHLLSKPAFSTLQQHFSPLKNHAPKPSTASYLAPPSPSKLPQNVALSAEVSRLQAELLQLSLLHREAARVEREYGESARGKLEGRWEDLCEVDGELRQGERALVGHQNDLALNVWSEIGELALGEKVQMLDLLLAEVWKEVGDLGDGKGGKGGGRYGRCVRRFERWMQLVQNLLEEREQPSQGDDSAAPPSAPELRFMADINTEWKDDCLLLQRKSSEWSATLHKLGSVSGDAVLEKSTLAIVLRGLRELVDGVSAEVQGMEKMEKLALQGEREWIREAIGVESDEERDGKGRDVPGAIWRRM